MNITHRKSRTKCN